MKLRLLDRKGWSALRALRFTGASSLSLALVLVLALGLPGCGPGTGGTGSGYPVNTAQSGNASWFQGSWSSLAFAADSSSAAAPGCASQAVAACASTVVLLDILASGIGVNAGCWTFAYDGQWGDPASSKLRVTGLYSAPAASGSVATQTADLLIETRDTDVVLTVLDANGRVLQGPVTLMRSPGGPGASSPSIGCASPQGALVKG